MFEMLGEFCARYVRIPPDVLCRFHPFLLPRVSVASGVDFGRPQHQIGMGKCAVNLHDVSCARGEMAVVPGHRVVLIPALFAGRAAGHGAMFIPPARNAGVNATMVNDDGCQKYACQWFSESCTIGCNCTGDPSDTRVVPVVPPPM